VEALRAKHNFILYLVKNFYVMDDKYTAKIYITVVKINLILGTIRAIHILLMKRRYFNFGLKKI
jgi:hypothetical protein